MTNIKQLIETTNQLCKSLDTMSNNERRFCAEMQLALERTSWEIMRQMNDLEELANYYGAVHVL